jgi:zinc protease
MDAQFKSILQNLKNQLLQLQANDTIRIIKNLWIQKQLAQTNSNTGTALLLQKGLELFSENPNPAWYLQEYNYIQTATLQDYLEILEYFPLIPPARIYSVDSKK